MYFPYLRGKQFELLALRSMAGIMAIHENKISPIIEPVKSVSSQLSRCVSELMAANVNFNIILNPTVGDLVKDRNASNIISCLKSTLRGYYNFQLAFLIDSDKSWAQMSSILSNVDFLYNGITLIHNYQCNNIKERLAGLRNIKYNVINHSTTSRRYHRNFPDYTKISLDDYFNSKPKNADYSIVDDEVFSDEYKFFYDEGFTGFADYLTIGSAYLDGGFMPYAVAIHLSYLGNNEELRVKHFVCDSTEDQEDTAGKFKEALNKLISWLKNSQHSTRASDEFKGLHHDGHFPGLGTVKKLSIENHLELVLKLI